MQFNKAQILYNSVLWVKLHPKEKTSTKTVLYKNRRHTSIWTIRTHNLMLYNISIKLIQNDSDIRHNAHCNVNRKNTHFECAISDKMNITWQFSTKSTLKFTFELVFVSLPQRIVCHSLRKVSVEYYCNNLKLFSCSADNKGQISTSLKGPVCLSHIKSCGSSWVKHETQPAIVHCSFLTFVGVDLTVQLQIAQRLPIYQLQNSVRHHSNLKW